MFMQNIVSIWFDSSTLLFHNSKHNIIFMYSSDLDSPLSRTISQMTMKQQGRTLRREFMNFIPTNHQPSPKQKSKVNKHTFSPFLRCGRILWFFSTDLRIRITITVLLNCIIFFDENKWELCDNSLFNIILITQII